MKNWNSKYWILGLIFISFVSHKSIYAETGIGKYAGEFISIGVGARALGLGGAYSSLTNDVTAGYWNPAGLSKLNYPQLSLMHSEQFGGLVNYDYAAFAIPFGSNSSLGISIIRLGIDEIPNTLNAWSDENGNGILDEDLVSSNITYFNATDWALYFTYSKRVEDNFAYGTNLKIIRREMNLGSATGIGFDIGIQYLPFKKFLLGANLQDATTTFIAWNTGTNELISPTMKLGSAYLIDALGGQFATAFDIDVRFENRRFASNLNLGPVSIDFHTGIEFDYKNITALRIGYSEIGTLNFGAGVKLPKFNIDYSFATSKLTDNRLDNTHRISLIFTFESENFVRISNQK